MNGTGISLFLWTWCVGIICVVYGFIEDFGGLTMFGLIVLGLAGYWTYWLYNMSQEPKRLEKRLMDDLLQTEQRQKELAHTIGLEKYHKMDIEDAENRKKGIEAMRVLGAVMPTSVYKEKEYDWAILGGIAEGIAGPAAGIAVAAETMMENAEIKARNAEREKWARQQQAFYMNLAEDAENELREPFTMYELEQRYRINTSWTPKALYKLISIKSKEVNINDNGSVTVRVNWLQKDKSLCIDGSLRANLYTSNGVLAGCAYLVFPKEGTLGFRGELVGICVEPEPSISYTIKIEPVNLWVLEPNKMAPAKKKV